jgi:hypothetical protein
MSYAYAGKIAGLGALGLGDYASDHAAWLQEKAAYTLAVQAFQGATIGQASNYAAAVAGYNRDLAAYNQALAAYAAASQAALRQQLANIKAYAAQNAQAKAAGAVIPAGYPGCVTQAQHDAWQNSCTASNSAWANTSVRGLGAVPTGPACALALLPVCQQMPPLPSVPPKPTPPAQPAPLTPPAPLRPEPQPPATVTAPRPVLTSSPSAPAPAVPFQNSPLGPDPNASLTPASTPTPPPASKSAGLIKNGLILVVLAGGGYALYRTFRKKKAA